MPLLSTFGGASLRTYGRGTEQVPAYVPAGTIVPINVSDITSATIPTNWTRFTGFDGRYVLGTTSNSEIGVTGAAAGNVSFTMSSSTAGAHTGGVPNDWFIGTTSGASYMYTLYEAASVERGAHTHSSLWLNCADARSNTVTTPFISCSERLDVLPPNAVVFRKLKPTSAQYSAYRPAGSGHFYGATNTGWNDNTSVNVLTGQTSSAGQHVHDPDNATITSSIRTTSNIPPGFTRTLYDHLAAGDHTHTVTVSGVDVKLKSKELLAWTSSQSEPVEYGMILMYQGNLSTLPAGWRVCNGQLGTPDMADYFLGYTLNEIHDGVIDTAHTITPTATTLATSSMNHTHQSVNPLISENRSNPYSYGPHASLSVSHTHTVVSTAFSSFTTAYQPPFRKVAFIQYKGI